MASVHGDYVRGLVRPQLRQEDVARAHSAPKSGIFATFLLNDSRHISVLFPSFCIIQRVGSARLCGQIISSASLGSLPQRADNLPAWPVARSGKPAGSLVGGVMTSRKVLLCGEISEKMHFHLILEINSTFKIKIKHI